MCEFFEPDLPVSDHTYWFRVAQNAAGIVELDSACKEAGAESVFDAWSHGVMHSVAVDLISRVF